MGRTLDIHIEIPKDASEQSLRIAESEARGAAVVALQQQGELTIREAATEMGLTYEGYLNLLAKKGLPATSDDLDPAVMDLLRQSIERQRS